MVAPEHRSALRRRLPTREREATSRSVAFPLLVCPLMREWIAAPGPQGVAPDAKELYGAVKDLITADYAKDKARHGSQTALLDTLCWARPSALSMLQRSDVNICASRLSLAIHRRISRSR